MKYLLFLTSLFLSTAFATDNQATTCTFGDKTRTIEVVYPVTGGKACEVQYSKGSNMQILWSANSEVNYCEKRATAFVEKQRGWGWDCTTNHADVDSEPSVEPEDIPKAVEKSVEKTKDATEEVTPVN